MRYSLIDTHCHVTCDELYERIDDIIKNAEAQDVNHMLVICTDFKEYSRAEILQEQYKGMFDVALGFHPNDLYKFHDADYQRMETLFQQNKLIALGEIGLDYHYGDVAKEVQKEALIRQIALAKKYDKPVLIHMRDATKDTLAILQEHAPMKGIVHCYSGSYETAKRLMEAGLYISFAGPITFKNAKGLAEVAKQIPLDRLFIETDSPYLTPHPFRGKQNEPQYVSYTFRKLCELKGVEEGVLAEQLIENYNRLFDLKF